MNDEELKEQTEGTSVEDSEVEQNEEIEEIELPSVKDVQEQQVVLDSLKEDIEQTEVPSVVEPSEQTHLEEDEGIQDLEEDDEFTKKKLKFKLIFLLFGFIITTLIYFICKFHI